MKKIFCLVLLVLLSSTPIFANVFAFNISVNTSGDSRKISYRLNEPATTVQIQVFGPLPSTTVIDTFAGTTAKGLNTVEWVGTGSHLGNTYGFKIIASNTPGYTDWTKINDTSATISQLYSPRTGVSVNKNNGSPYFGMVYTGETFGGTTTSGRPLLNRGILALYPDGSDPLGIGDTPRDGGIAWSTASTSYNSPYHIFVAPDDRVYICSWADAFAGLWRAEPDLSGTFTQIFDNTGADATGVAAGLHGSVAGVWVEGTGASTIVYSYDEDLPAPTGSPTVEPGLRNIWKYPIGNGPFPWSTVPTIQINEMDFSSYPMWDATWGLLVNDVNGGVKRDSSGNWYVSNYRAGSGMPTLYKFTPDGKTILWETITNGVAGGTDPLINNMGGFAIDEANNRIAMAINSVGFIVFPFNPIPVGNLATNMTTVTIDAAATSYRGIDFDAAGNIYLPNSTSELLYIYSPPGANTFTSQTSLTLPGGASLAAQPQWSIYE